ncbi:GNAT family N-acetyltransferase [Angustibacter aerolatus]|uniref:N-acetyltransferase domain-containing protein n=1 Tax=Angustibacter aerolatus TaxID=1162965 RepID=A0ABQ6JA38_9ACTN|nr:hypothetical protein GCM10025868_02970 [Angustibacter aerolatus]
MPQGSVLVRSVHPDDAGDVQALTTLWVASRTSQRGVSDADEVGQMLSTALRRDGVEAHLARVDGADVGFVVLSHGPLMPLLDEPSVAIEHLFVLDEVRRKGVGRALIARATTSAEASGAGQISTSAPASGRDCQRFFARLGFSPFVVRRVASVPALRRRLAAGEHEAIDITLAARRALRARSRALALRTRSTG